jgi:hypothetical protein
MSFFLGVEFMDYFLMFAGLGLLYVLMNFSNITTMVGKYLRQKHLEKIISQMSEPERTVFIKRYLEEQDEHPAKSAAQELESKIKSKAMH